MEGFVPKLIEISPSRSSAPIFVLPVGRTGMIDVAGPRREEINGTGGAMAEASVEIGGEFGFVRCLRVCGERRGDARASYRFGITRVSDNDMLKESRQIGCKRVSSVGCHFFGLSQNKQMAQRECFDYLFFGIPSYHSTRR